MTKNKKTTRNFLSNSKKSSEIPQINFPFDYVNNVGFLSGLVCPCGAITGLG
jgi:hypothetical protein